MIINKFENQSVNLILFASRLQNFKIHRIILKILMQTQAQVRALQNNIVALTARFESAFVFHVFQ